jgi:hypothetical protein
MMTVQGTNLLMSQKTGKIKLKNAYKNTTQTILSLCLG